MRYSSRPRTRKRVLFAQNDDRAVYARIEVTVGVRENRLTRDEQATLVEALASKAMVNLAEARHLYVPLSRVKVSR